MADTAKWHFRLFSTSVLLALGLFLTATTISTNIFLALSLPSASSPTWISPGNEVIFRNGDKKSDTNQDMLHVVTSRFMQLQPDLVSLGEARLQLFETFCLPSMLVQQADNFVWFIMTDPSLEPVLLNRMKELLSPHRNFYLVLMNDKLVTSNILPSMIKDDLFATGDVDRLRSLMLDTNRPLLLETRLDADDALSAITLQRIQDSARDLPVDLTGWQVICNNLHFEWRNDEITDVNQTMVTSGQLRLVMESICVTAGYTLVRHRPPGSIAFPAWPKIGHHLMNREWPKCLGNTNATSNCWTRLPRYPAALRSRTATSAGMSRIEATPKDKFYDNQTETLWSYVTRDFGILPEDAKATSRYMKEHLGAIVEDNLKGQWYDHDLHSIRYTFHRFGARLPVTYLFLFLVLDSTYGHSCKESSMKKLSSLLIKTSNGTNSDNSTLSED